MRNSNMDFPTETRRVVMDIYDIPVDTPMNEMPKDMKFSGKLISAVPVFGDHMDDNNKISSKEDYNVSDHEYSDNQYTFDEQVYANLLDIEPDELSNEIICASRATDLMLSDNIKANKEYLNDILAEHNNADLFNLTYSMRLKNFGVAKQLGVQLASIVANALEHNVQSTIYAIDQARHSERRQLYRLIKNENS